VIYVVPEKFYYVHHAGSGVECKRDFERAIAALAAALGVEPAEATPTRDVFCIYAHEKDEAGYRKSVKEIIGYGLNADRVFQLFNLSTNQFGINNLGQLGY
jgi:hypothetical protein